MYVLLVKFMLLRHEIVLHYFSVACLKLLWVWTNSTNCTGARVYCLNKSRFLQVVIHNCCLFFQHKQFICSPSYLLFQSLIYSPCVALKSNYFDSLAILNVYFEFMLFFFLNFSIENVVLACQAPQRKNRLSYKNMENLLHSNVLQKSKFTGNGYTLKCRRSSLNLIFQTRDFSSDVNLRLHINKWTEFQQHILFST